MDRPVEPRQPEASESNVAYVGVDMAHGHKMAEAMYQVDRMKHIRPKAWFVDIVHTPNQLQAALALLQQLAAELHTVSPELKAANITLCLNLTSARRLRARNTMYGLFRDHRTKNVVFRSPDGREQPIEY